MTWQIPWTDVYKRQDVHVSKICGYLEDEIFHYEKDHPGVEIRKKIADARGSQQEQNDQIDQFISLDSVSYTHL